VDYAELLPDLFMLHAGTFYLQLASESDRPRVLRIINEHSRADQRIFVGVIPVERLGTCDDCGFTRSPTTRPRPGRSRSPRSTPGWRGHDSRPKPSGSDG
jgi:hypothetical protein